MLVRPLRRETALAGLLLFFLSLTGLTGPVSAGDSLAAASKSTEKPDDLCRTLLDLPTLYQNESNPVLQRLRIIGRYHGQIYSIESNQDDASAYETRRSRIGAEAALFQQVVASFNLNLDLDGNGDRFLQDLEDATLEWKPSSQFTIIAGKIKVPITHEWRTSSKEILTLERSWIVTQTVPKKTGSLLVAYKPGDWIFESSVASNTVDSDWKTPSFDGGWSLFGSVGRKIGKKGMIRGEYLYSNQDPADNVTQNYDGIASLAWSQSWDKFSLAINPVWAHGGTDGGEARGFYVLPSFAINENLELVLRYQFAEGDGDGMPYVQREPRLIGNFHPEAIDNLHAAYIGLNYYLCGHNLKLMTGLEYTQFDTPDEGGFDGWSWITGVRLYF